MKDIANQLLFEATLSRLLQQLPWCIDLLVPVVPPPHVPSEATQPLNPARSPSIDANITALAHITSTGSLEI